MSALRANASPCVHGRIGDTTDLEGRAGGQNLAPAVLSLFGYLSRGWHETGLPLLAHREILRQSKTQAQLANTGNGLISRRLAPLANDPGCVKTRRRSIAIEQVTRSRPSHVPTSQAHSVLKSKSRILFSSRFELLSFHTAWTHSDPQGRAKKSAPARDPIRQPRSDVVCFSLEPLRGQNMAVVSKC